jgi:hypothetical protein
MSRGGRNLGVSEIVPISDLFLSLAGSNPSRDLADCSIVTERRAGHIPPQMKAEGFQSSRMYPIRNHQEEEPSRASGRRLLPIGVHPGAAWPVDDFVAVKAHDFNRDQQNSTSRPQQVQHQSLGINRILQISIRSGIWFGTRGSEVQILSPRPFTSIPSLN